MTTSKLCLSNIFRPSLECSYPNTESNLCFSNQNLFLILFLFELILKWTEGVELDKIKFCQIYLLFTDFIVVDSPVRMIESDFRNYCQCLFYS